MLLEINMDTAKIPSKNRLSGRSVSVRKLGIKL
jgi:hypothetical protein